MKKNWKKINCEVILLALTLCAVTPAGVASDSVREGQVVEVREVTSSAPRSIIPSSDDAKGAGKMPFRRDEILRLREEIEALTLDNASLSTRNADLSRELFELMKENNKLSSAYAALQLTAAEAGRIEAALPNGCRIIALDERGDDLTTVKLSQQLDKWLGDGRDVALLIGGADGLAASLKDRADGMIRLSSLTLPHAVARLLLCEQLYRAWSLLKGHPYHRE